MKIELPPPFREDYNILYGQYYEDVLKKIGDKSYILVRAKKPTEIDYKGKLVLDIGADIGSTASFFIEKKAQRVIAVEKEKDFFVHLERNAKELGRISPIHLDVSCQKTLENLIDIYNPNIVKMDCEGCEVHLLHVDEKIVRIPEMYIIEIHKVPLLSVKAIPKGWLDKIPEEYLPEDDNRMIVQEDFSKVIKEKLETCGFEIVSTLRWSSDKEQFNKHISEIIYARRK